MNKLREVFKINKESIVSIYFSAGYPNLNSTTKIIKNLAENGADFIEVGIPFSDPLADGPTIQESGSIALKNGMNLSLLFDQLSEIKESNSVPLIMMGYWNSILQFGVEKFLISCKNVGIAGAILPDLPLEVYERKYKDLFEKYEIPFIFLISPQTSEERIKKIDQLSNGFIYAVSSSSTTGNKNGIESAEPYLKRIQSYQLKSPLVTGFNIKTKKDVVFATQFTNGVVIGSAFINALKKNASLEENITEFMSEYK
ncbi:MAG: tryptophan synthase subunit alpha [Flavobacteriaceae bacterium]|nr:tryptophan synthase subunit alpha [Flavobacteriaceae bacterium]